MDLSRRWRSMPAYGSKAPMRRPGEPESNRITRWSKALLYGKVESTHSEQEEEHPRSDLLCTLLLICVMVGVSSTVLYFQIATWPNQTNSYYTDDPQDNMRGGLTFTCGCSLPASLQSVQNPSETTNLNICYQTSSLENAIILMYSNSTAEALLDQVIAQNSPTRPRYKTHDGGVLVSQEAHDLMVENGFLFDLNNLYPGGYQQPSIYPTMEYLRSSDFNDFPKAYMRISWIYDCYNCTGCSLELVNELGSQIVSSKDDVWVSCSYYGMVSNDCASDNMYTAKCLLYPPETLPASFAVQRFLDSFLALPGISNISGVRNDHYNPNANLPGIGITFDMYPTNYSNSVALEPSILYLNTSHTSSSSIRLGFVEVEKGSATWASLLNSFPTVENECADLPPVLVCNGTSVCNVFSHANSYDSRCLQATNHSQCQPWSTSPVSLQGPLAAQNVNSSESMDEIICPTSFNCDENAPYSVIWNTSELMKNDALNVFLASSILSKEWAQQSGVCTNTYTKVIRHPRAADGGGASSGKEVEPMFLQTNCTPDTPTQSSFCWLTGYYHNLTDSPRAPWKPLSNDLLWSTDSRFACYRVDRAGFTGWFITTCGVLFGWIGTIQLVFYTAFAWLFVPARRNLQRNTKAHVFPG